MADEANALLDEQAVARLLHVTKRTVGLWRKSRGLPFLKLTTKIIRFRGPDVLEWAGGFRVKIVASSPQRRGKR